MSATANVKGNSKPRKSKEKSEKSDSAANITPLVIKERGGVQSWMNSKKAASKNFLKEYKKPLLQHLKMIGAATVTVNYSGGGDSGGVDFVEVKDKDGVEIPKEKQGHMKVLMERSTWVEDKWVAHEVEEQQPLEEILTRFTDNWTDYHHGGWYNNDGGEGHVDIDVASKKIELTHVTFYSESHVDEYTL